MWIFESNRLWANLDTNLPEGQKAGVNQYTFTITQFFAEKLGYAVKIPTGDGQNYIVVNKKSLQKFEERMAKATSANLESLPALVKTHIANLKPLPEPLPLPATTDPQREFQAKLQEDLRQRTEELQQSMQARFQQFAKPQEEAPPPSSVAPKRVHRTDSKKRRKKAGGK